MDTIRVLIADDHPFYREGVQNQVSNIFSKLQVADRAQAIVRARAAGWDWNRVSRLRIEDN